MLSGLPAVIYCWSHGDTSSLPFDEFQRLEQEDRGLPRIRPRLEEAPVKDLRLSRRIAALAPSSTIAAGRKAKALAAMGVDVVDFSIGEPDFATPAFVGRAGVRAIEAGRPKYTDSAGAPRADPHARRPRGRLRMPRARRAAAAP